MIISDGGHELIAGVFRWCHLCPSHLKGGCVRVKRFITCKGEGAARVLVVGSMGKIG